MGRLLGGMKNGDSKHSEDQTSIMSYELLRAGLLLYTTHWAPRYKTIDSKTMTIRVDECHS